MVTQASQWKSAAKTGEHEMELPSGNTALLRSIKPEAFLESGMIPDPLAGMIQQAISSKRGLPPAKMNEIASDPKKLAAAMEMFDRALVYCVVEPEVQMPPLCIHTDEEHPEPCGYLYTSGDGVHISRKHPDFHKYVEEPRDPEVLYADVVDMTDKQFIFQWAIGGVSDVDRFREELRASVDALQAEQGMGGKAKQPARSK